MAIRKRPKDDTYFSFYNHNPKDRRTGDCVIRAIGLATSQSWEGTLQDLCECALKYKLSPLSVENFNKYLKTLGFVKCKQARKSDNTKYMGYEFVKYLISKEVTSPVVASIGSHHVTVFAKLDSRDSITCCDIWNPNEYCVGNFWVKQEEASKFEICAW